MIQRLGKTTLDMPDNKDRFRALDGLRGIAALMVVFYHTRFPNHFTHGLFVENGYVAVDLFFILSGFVIYASYSAVIKDAPSMQRFICLRFFRIYAPNSAMLLAFIGLELAKLTATTTGTIVPGIEPFTGTNTCEGLVEKCFFSKA